MTEILKKLFFSFLNHTNKFIKIAVVSGKRKRSCQNLKIEQTELRNFRFDILMISLFVLFDLNKYSNFYSITITFK